MIYQLLYSKFTIFFILFYSSTFFSQLSYTILNYFDSNIKILFMLFFKVFVIGAILLTILLYEKSLNIIKVSKWFILTGIILVLNEIFHKIETFNDLGTFFEIFKQIMFTKYISSYIMTVSIFSIFEIYYRKRVFDKEHLNLFVTLVFITALCLFFNRFFGETILPFVIFQQFINNNTIAYETVLGVIILIYFKNDLNKSRIFDLKLIILSCIPILLSSRGAILILIIIFIISLLHFRSTFTNFTKIIIVALISLNIISIYDQTFTEKHYNFLDNLKCTILLDKKYIDKNLKKGDLEFDYKNSLESSKKIEGKKYKECINIYENTINQSDNRILIGDDFFSIQSRIMVDYIAVKYALKNIINGVGSEAYYIKFDNVGIHSLWALMLVSNGLIFLIPIHYSIYKYFIEFKINFKNITFIPILTLFVFQLCFVNQFNYVYSFCLILPIIFASRSYKDGS